MGASFSLAGRYYNGTNGGIEVYVEALHQIAEDRLGPDDPWTEFFLEERETFFSGKNISLDDLATDKESRDSLQDLFTAATERLIATGAFTEYGRSWVQTTISELCKAIINAPCPPSP